MRPPRCQVPACRTAVTQAVEIELPVAWEASSEFTVLSVTVGACEEHGFELDRRARALLQARSDLSALLRVIEAAVESDRQLRDLLAACLVGTEVADGGGAR